MGAAIMALLCLVTYVTAIWLMAEQALHEVDACVLAIVAAVGFIAFYTAAISG